MENGTVVKSLPKLIGKGYKQFWEYKGRYRIVKGGRGSKKSTTASFWFPYNMMKYWHQYGVKPHTLVIRRYYNTHKDSTYAQILWAINQMGVRHLWHVTKSPLEMTYKPSGQKIMFRGLDDPESINSITVADGDLCWTWWEEGYQVTNEDDFNKVDLSIRGKMPYPLFKQHTITMNPWSEKTWIKKRFFDEPDEDTLALTRNYDVNEFLDEADIKIFEVMKIKSPRRYKIEGLGEWGISEGLIYENWEVKDFDYKHMRTQTDNYGKAVYTDYNGLDFGYSNDPTAFIGTFVDRKKKEIYIYEELYKTKLTNKQIHAEIKYREHGKSKIEADSADPRTINELRILGLARIHGAKKKPGSVKAGIQKLQEYKIFVHHRCPNAEVELSNYVWDTDKKTGELTGQPIDDFNHLMDALRYATISLSTDKFSW
jgi:phage terminase large subunit